MTASIVGTSLHGTGPVTHRGFIDIVDCLQGVRGWALDLANPTRPVALELMVGDTPVSTTSSDAARHDISEALGVEVAPGFAFEPATLALLADMADSGEDMVWVRIAGTPYALGIGDAPPSADDIITRLKQLAAPAQPRSDTADFDLLLDDLRTEAATLVDQPLRAIPENLQGYVETLAIDTAGQVWMIGWMRRGHLTEFSAVISERRKFPAAIALMTFSREDLPADACGVIGLLSSTWRPTSATAEFFIFFGSGGRFHLRAHTPLRFITPTELVAEYEGVRERALGEGRAIALQRMLTSLESWMPTRSAAQGFATETSVDRVLLVPGLGCLVEGWVISPLKRIEGLRLRIGGATMAAQADATYWKPRPDLLASFPGSDRLVHRAGFVALFTGDADADDFSDPVIKVVFQGGASANYPISPKVFRRLGHSAALEDALLFFPALQEESFFPRFADAAIRAQRGAMNPPVAMTVTRSRRAMVMVLPEDRCDLFLLFEELARHCRPAAKIAMAGAANGGASNAPSSALAPSTLAPSTLAPSGGIEGVALIASSMSNRSDALWLFQEFQRTTNIPASLLVIDEASHAFALLPDILRTIGANRFVFTGPGVFLNDAGWAHARQILQDGSPDLTFLALEPDDFEQQNREHGVTARCFAWNTPHFVRWSANAASFLGGFHRENGLFRSNVPHTVHRNAARNSRWLLPARIHDAVNTAVYGMGARF